MIVYFSGTGNSRWCADLLADRLQDDVLDSFGYMQNGIAADLISGKPWVFVCPTYAWKIPHIFEQFIRSGSFMGEQEAYFVLTCGSEAGGAGAFLDELCQSVGLRYMGMLEVVLPENYVAMFPIPNEKKSAHMFDKARPLLEETAGHIADRRPLPGKSPTGFDRLKSNVVNKVFYKHFITAKPFTVSDKCIGCGKCVQSCVLNNIVLQNGKPAWGTNCTHCMACICGCPTKAIEYGRMSLGKRRYQAPRYK